MRKTLAALLVFWSGIAQAQVVSTPSAAIKVPYTVCQSGVAVPTTGTTAETAQATCNIPAIALGTNNCLFIEAAWSYTNNANNKTMRLRFSGIGGTTYATTTQTTNLGVRLASSPICNRGVTGSQVGYQGLSFTGAPVTSAVDTTVATSVVLSSQLAVGTDTATLEYYSVTLVPAP